jgi:uncharacterized protein YpuA (DUF1002 family)
MKPRTKIELKEQLKISVNNSLFTDCKSAKEEAKDTPYDWDLTMADAIAKENAQFRKYVADFKAKSQTSTKLVSSSDLAKANGADRDRT